MQLCVAEIVSPKLVLTELDGRLGCLVLVVVLFALHGLVAHPAFLAAALAAQQGMPPDVLACACRIGRMWGSERGVLSLRD